MRQGEIYLIWWEWPDKSGMGFIRAYDNQIQADRDYVMMKSVAEGYKDIHLDVIEIQEEE